MSSAVVAGDLVEDLMWLLCCRKKLSRAALHLLLVPQLKSLSLVTCPSLVTPSLCVHIASRCWVGQITLNTVQGCLLLNDMISVFSYC